MMAAESIKAQKEKLLIYLRKEAEPLKHRWKAAVIWKGREKREETAETHLLWICTFTTSLNTVER